MAIACLPLSQIWSVMKFVCVLLPAVLLAWILTGAGSSLGIMLGWSSACLYLSSRAPQLWKNYTSKSTGDLSMYLFLLAMLGNATYGASVVAFSSDVSYLMKQAPWLLGSVGMLVPRSRDAGRRHSGAVAWKEVKM